MLTQEDDVEIHAVAARGWHEAAIARHIGQEESVIARLSELSVIHTVELPAPELALPLVEALIGNDLPCLEITFRTEAAFEAPSLVKAHHPDVLLAAGTVFSLERTKMAVEAGVDVVISPGTNPAVAALCAERGVAALPGVCTPTDIELALSLGVNTLKFFPAELMGRNTVSSGGERAVPGRSLRPHRRDHRPQSRGLTCVAAGLGMRWHLDCQRQGSQREAV